MSLVVSLLLLASVPSVPAVEPTHVVLGADGGLDSLGLDLAVTGFVPGAAAEVTALSGLGPAVIVGFDAGSYNVRYIAAPVGREVTQLADLGSWAFTDGAADVLFAYGNGDGLPVCVAPNCQASWGLSRAQALLDRATGGGDAVDPWIGDSFAAGLFRHAIPWASAVAPYPDGGGVAGWVALNDIGEGDGAGASASVVATAHCVSGDAYLGRWAAFAPGIAGGRGEFVVAAPDPASSLTRFYVFTDPASVPDEGRGCTSVRDAGADLLLATGVTAYQIAYAAPTALSPAWFALLDPVTGVSAAVAAATRDGLSVDVVADASVVPRDIVTRTRPVVLTVDLLGDDTPDLIVADPLSAAGGTVRIWTAVPDAAAGVRFERSPDIVLEVADVRAQFGTSLAVTPDVDGDGHPELAVGAPGWNASSGAVMVYLSSTLVPAAEPDADGDGTPDATDCFPDDPALFPGATVYADADTDGHGDPNTPLRLTCPDAGGHALQGDDCDDVDPDVSPGAVEICNDRDDDCDGGVDVGLLAIFWVDSDGDGQGDPSSVVEACAPSGGLADNADDCDDARSDVAVGAPEVLDDGIDQDCDGNDRTVAWSGGCATSGAPGAPGWALATALLVLAGVRRRGAGG